MFNKPSVSSRFLLLNRKNSSWAHCTPGRHWSAVPKRKYQDDQKTLLFGSWMSTWDSVPCGGNHSTRRIQINHSVQKPYGTIICYMRQQTLRSKAVYFTRGTYSVVEQQLWINNGAGCNMCLIRYQPLPVFIIRVKNPSLWKKMLDFHFKTLLLIIRLFRYWRERQFLTKPIRYMQLEHEITENIRYSLVCTTGWAKKDPKKYFC